MSEKRYPARLHSPADENGERYEVDVITSSDAVYVGSKTLTKVLEELGNQSSSSGGIILSESNDKPSTTCTWAMIKSKE